LKTSGLGARWVAARWESSAVAGTRTPISPTISGSVVGFRLSGVEPDGDPLYEVLLSTTLSASNGVPRMHLIVDSYMENFQPDTTPILPDLLHPTQTAQNLGGFLEGKALLTDDAGAVLYRGSFTAEAFLNNTNHAVMALYGTGAAGKSGARLKGAFTLHKNASLNGPFQGTISLPAGARAQLARHAGARMRPIKQILSGVTVKPHPMVGRPTSGGRGTPLPTGYSQAPGTTSQPGHSLSPITIVAGAGAILSFLMAGALWWWQRTHPAGQPEGADQDPAGP
jgi:hypothetical protein